MYKAVLFNLNLTEHENVLQYCKYQYNSAPQ
jgi:hypothetical protein